MSEYECIQPIQQEGHHYENSHILNPSKFQHLRHCRGVAKNTRKEDYKYFIMNAYPIVVYIKIVIQNFTKSTPTPLLT